MTEHPVGIGRPVVTDRSVVLPSPKISQTRAVRALVAVARPAMSLVVVPGLPSDRSTLSRRTT